MWTVILLDEVETWFFGLDADTRNQVAAIDMLEEYGPRLGRPLVDRIKGSSRHNMKELRPATGAGTTVRILFIFDPQRQAVLLVAGDKAGQWTQWYDQNIPVADSRYDDWQAGRNEEEDQP